MFRVVLFRWFIKPVKKGVFFLFLVCFCFVFDLVAHRILGKMPRHSESVSENKIVLFCLILLCFVLIIISLVVEVLVIFVYSQVLVSYQK